jgi:hypothetical protein
VKGEGTIFPKKGKSFDPVLIPKVIKDAGFTATEVTVVADGTLAAENGAWKLEVPDLTYSFVLVGGPKADMLTKRADLLGKRIRITGKLSPSQAGPPGGISVEDFQPLP